MIRVIIIMLIVFSINPVFTISIMRIRFVPKMIAFGGVATGNINAMEAASVAGIINNNGLIFITLAKPARIGKIISVVATFDVNSVNSEIRVTFANVKTMG